LLIFFAKLIRMIYFYKKEKPNIIMKKLLLITLLIIPFCGFSQTTTPIDGFLGIKFGSSKQAVIAAIRAKGGVLEKNAPGPLGLAFDKVKLGNRQCAAFVVKFIDDKAFCAVFSFEPKEQPKTIDYYNSLVSDLSEKYGPGKPTADFKEPFKLGDGNEILAIQGGYVAMYTDWDSNDHSIQASIDHDGDGLSVTLIYTDEKLQAIVDAKQKAKQNSDM